MNYTIRENKIFKKNHLSYLNTIRLKSLWFQQDRSVDEKYFLCKQIYIVYGSFLEHATQRMEVQSLSVKSCDRYIVLRSN